MRKFKNILRSAGAKRALFALFAVASVAQCFAAGNGMAGINEATSMISSYFDPGTKLIYAIGAVVGLIGGVKVYGKFSSGDPVRCAPQSLYGSLSTLMPNTVSMV